MNDLGSSILRLAKMDQNSILLENLIEFSTYKTDQADIDMTDQPECDAAELDALQFGFLTAE